MLLFYIIYIHTQTRLGSIGITGLLKDFLVQLSMLVVCGTQIHVVSVYFVQVKVYFCVVDLCCADGSLLLCSRIKKINGPL